jgi:hypothetical protein
LNGLYSALNFDVEVNGQVYPVQLKPRHRVAAREHFRGQDIDDEQALLWSCWKALNEYGVVPETFELFMEALDDYGPVEDADPKAESSS